MVGQFVKMILSVNNVHLNERQFGGRSLAFFSRSSFFLFSGSREVGIERVADELSPNSESFAQVVEIVKVKAFFVSNNFEEVTLKAAFAEAVIEPSVAFEFNFNRSSIWAFSVTANGANDVAFVGITTWAGFLENEMRVVSVNFIFQVVGYRTVETFYSLDVRVSRVG